MSSDVPHFPMTRAAGCPFDPPPAAIAQQKKAPLTKVRLWDDSTSWLVTRLAEQRALLDDPRISADISKPGFPHLIPLPPGGGPVSFVVMDGPKHARLRRMVTAPFAAKRVEALQPAVQRIVDLAIDAMLAGPKPVDLVDAFALPVPSLVISELLGVPYSDHGFFQNNAKIIATLDVEAQGRARRELIGYLDDLMGRKIVAPADDLLSDLAERVKAGELTRSEAAQMGVMLLIAGHATTENMIALGTLALLEHPAQLELLRDSDDPKLLASAVEELLRYLSVIHTRNRIALEDIDIAGERIRAGDGLIFVLDTGSRDPDAFEEPDRLDIERDSRHHMAFGFGAHRCLGKSLARLELQVAFSTLFRRIPTLRLAADIEGVPFRHDNQVYGVYELPITW
ncbi:cytochrome P450 [Streptomyces sp. NPDC050433]|uniref:cytochrome P450 n=1 Tax=Streptomyces sp. NPDC050433 TaxID=3365615 RepID=UPI0037ABB0E0